MIKKSNTMQTHGAYNALAAISSWAFLANSLAHKDYSSLAYNLWALEFQGCSLVPSSHNLEDCA